MKRYILIHDNHYGQDIYLFMSDAPIQEVKEYLPRVAYQLNVDYEPDKDESLSVIQFKDESTQIIKLFL